MALSPDSQTDPYARDSSADVNAILQGMTDATIDRQQERRNQAQVLPAQLQSSPQPAQPAPAALPAQVQPGYQPNLPPQVQPNQPNYTVQGTGPGTWWRQQQQNQPPIPPQFQQNQPPVSLQPQLQPPQQASLNPRDPGFRYIPPQNSERPPVNNMPLLWGANQRGPSGLTKQQFLTQKLMHESQGDPTALNYVARGDPRMYHPGTDAYGRPRPGYSASGLLQNINDTWDSGVKWALADPDRYPMYGDDPRKYPVAGYAPWQTQWQVNSAVYDHAGETPWNERGGLAGASYKARLDGGFYNSMAEPTQNYAPAQPRSFAEWGRAPVGMGGTQPGQMPRHTDFGRIMGAVAPLMVGLVSLAARMPLSTAITAYGAMARAQQNGQQLDYQRNRTRFQDQLKEHNAQQALESQEAGDAFSEYGNNNPQGLQQTLASIALKYNDPTMFRMAQNGDLNGIHQLQQRRDMGHQDLTKLERAQQEHQDRQAQDAAVKAMDEQFVEQYTKENGHPPDANTMAIEHNKHIGEAGRAGTKDPRTTEEKPGQEKTAIELAGAKARTDDWAKAQNPPVEPGSNAYKEHLAEEVQKGTQAKPEQEGPKASDYKDYEWEGADDGQKHRGSAAIVPGKGLVDPQGQPINAKPSTINAVSTKGADDKLSEPKTWDVVGPDGKVRRTVNLRDRKSGPGFEDAETGQPFTKAPDETLLPHDAKRAEGDTKFGSMDDLMRRWHEQFVKDNGREPTTDEIAQQHSHYAQESSKPTQGNRQIGERLMIGANDVAKTLTAISQLPKGTTLGMVGGAQAALGPEMFDNMRRGLVNRATPLASQMLATLANGLGRSLGILAAAGASTGLVGLSNQLAKDVPAAGDKGFNVLLKLADMRQIADAALEVLAVDPNLSADQKAKLAEIQQQIQTAVPYTTSDVIGTAFNKSDASMRDLAIKMGLGKEGQRQSGEVNKPSWAQPYEGKQPYNQGRPIFHEGDKWYFDDHTLVPGQ